VLLDGERDALGMPRIRLDWRLTDLDRRSLLRTHEALAKEFGRTGLGRIQIEAWLQDDKAGWSDELSGGYHPMGTTRMADDPRRGVVDRHCRVHGLTNLYVAGSSVFPTGGSANPTLTIVALALRLAEHLKAELSV
jgi:choline dehydrogenase-like flavoprotein